MKYSSGKGGIAISDRFQKMRAVAVTTVTKLLIAFNPACLEDF